MKNSAAEANRPLPHGNCYAVVPGRLIAGEYPARFPAAGSGVRFGATRRVSPQLEAIISYGVTDFVDLTTDEDGLEPYTEAVKRIADKLGKKISHNRYPIYDGTAPARDDQTRAILDFIGKRIEEGGCVYLHCWGGIGRTGTIVGCFLVRHGVDPDEALGKVEGFGRSMAKYDPYWTSPENELQKNYVRNWSKKECKG
jgi:protein-tyrosine phosphatase